MLIRSTSVNVFSFKFLYYSLYFLLVLMICCARIDFGLLFESMQSDARALRTVLSLTGVKEGLRGHIMVELSDLTMRFLLNLLVGSLSRLL